MSETKLCNGCLTLVEKRGRVYCETFDRYPFPAFKSGKFLYRRTSECINKDQFVAGGSID